MDYYKETVDKILSELSIAGNFTIFIWILFQRHKFNKIHSLVEQGMAVKFAFREAKKLKRSVSTEGN
jgi:hypothetical protein